MHESLLLELTALPTAAFCEERVQSFLDRWFARRKQTLRLRRDRAGNLLVTQRRTSRRKPILITAHLDHPAFVIHAIEGRSLDLEFRGGVMPPYFENARLEFFDEKDHKTTARVESLDPDAKPFKRVRARLSKPSESLKVGDVGRWALPKAAIVGGRLKTNACDDLAAVAAALVAFDAIRKDRNCGNVGLLFTTAEEIGFIGAIDAAKNGLIPKSARLICLENSRAFAESPIGAGAIVRVGDRISVFSPELTNRISAICLAEQQRDRSFKFQRKLMAGGACEATAFSGFGFESTCLCLPLANYHNMHDIDGVTGGKRPARVAREEIALSDFDSLVRMLKLVACELDSAPEHLKARLNRLHKTHAPLLKKTTRRTKPTRG